jgi:hypothetical protein
LVFNGLVLNQRSGWLFGAADAHIGRITARKWIMSVTRVYDKASSVMLVLVMLMACQVTGQSIPKPISTSTLPTPHMQPVSSPATQPLPTPSPTPWPLEIITVQETVPTCTQLLQLVPGKSTLQDVYKLVGYPNHKRDLPSGIALGYYSKHIKFKHIVLVNGVTGEVLLVGIVVYDELECPSLETLRAQYGEPTLAVTNGNRRHWFFEGHDIADTEMVLQILPPGTTLAEYQQRNGYFDESYAFTP